MATCSTATVRCKLWTEESMEAAASSVLYDNKGLWEAARLYNISVETLGRCVNGSVKLGFKPGPGTILTEEVEDKLAAYLVTMVDVGYGIKWDTVMEMAFMITKRKHPFREGKAGRVCFEGFQRRHPNLTIRSPQALAYNRAICANRETVDEFFDKLGSVYGQLNLNTKPMLIYNCDETVVHKPGKVIAELGHRNVYAVTSAEQGKTHTVLSCVSASGYVPPMIIYPRKKSVPDGLKGEAIPGTYFIQKQWEWLD